VKIAARFVRQAMVNEIAERGQLALQASTLAVDMSSPSSRATVLYGRAAGVEVLAAPSSSPRVAVQCGYSFSHAEAEHLAQGALAVLEHIRATVL
jgi:hypothetical protein